jgi:predicted enzyme related to lactoylglutathione lyase
MNLNQVTVPASDIAASIDFYKKLGLIEIVEELPKYARFQCPDGGSTFSIHHTELSPGPSAVVIYFECTDLDERVHDLKRQGIKFDTDPQDEPWLWREAHLRDPYGNNICLYYAGENRLNPPWRIGPAG